MSPEIVAAIIAVGGVIVSVVCSLCASYWTVSAQTRGLRDQIRQAFGSQLLEKRIEVYPALYEMVSDLVKVTRFGEVTKKVLVDLRSALEKWDSKNSIFLSFETGIKVHEFHMHLSRIAQMSDEAIAKAFAEESERQKLRDNVWMVERALKYDIGIYLTEFAYPGNAIPSRDQHKQRLSLIGDKSTVQQRDSVERH